MAITSSYLLEGVKRRITDPQHQNRLKNADILAFADQIIQSEIIPILESAQSDFFITQSEIPLVGGQSEYSIPYRAVGRNLREIKIRDDNNNPNNNFWRNLPLISIDNAYIYYAWTNVAGFYFKGDKIQLVPDVPDNMSVDQTLVLWWRLPPNKLVELDQVSVVQSIVGTTVYVDGVPGDIYAGALVDFVQSQSGSSILKYDIEVDDTDGNTYITFASVDDIPSDLVPGDYICVSGQSFVANGIPNEAYPLVETLTSRRCVQAIADYEAMKILDMDAKTERENFRKLIEPRIDGEPTIIINPWNLSRMFKRNQRTWLYGQ